MMFTTDLNTFKIRERELHQQAAQFRLAKRHEKAHSPAFRLAASAGQLLITAGEQIIRRTEK